MAGVHATPDELESFRNSLENYLETVQSETDTLSSAFDNLGDTWNDEKHSEFVEIFDELKRVINSFVERAEEEVPRLRKMEEHLREYQET